MRNVLQVASVFFFASHAFAGDPLPEIVKRRATKVNIYTIDSATVRSQGREDDLPYGIVDMTLIVEGNICGADESSLAYSLKRVNTGGFKVDLSVSENYIPEPNVLRACNMPSLPSKVTIPLEVTANLWENNQVLYSMDLQRSGLPLGVSPKSKLALSATNGNIRVRILD